MGIHRKNKSVDRNRSSSSQYKSERKQKHKNKHKYHKKDKKRHKHHHNDLKRQKGDPKDIFQSDRIKLQHKIQQQIKQEHIEQNQQKSQNRSEEEIEKPNFQPSGILLQYYNARDGVSLKFHEPPEAQKPTDQWRIYPFKDDQTQNPIILKQSCYLVGKDERVCDILCENQSISRQHAVIQFRAINKQNIDGSFTQRVKPYLMDLQSTNGTWMNGEKLEASRYYELLDKDSVKFGLSTREYVFFKVPTSEQEELEHS